VASSTQARKETEMFDGRL